MKNRFFNTFFAITLLTLLPNIIFSQISVTSGDFLSLIGKNFTTEEDTSLSIQVNVGNAGANQVWDFTSMTIENPLLSSNEFISPVGTPFADEFQNANLVNKISTTSDEFKLELYQYYNVMSNLFVSLGSGNFYATQPEFNSVTFYDDDLAPLPLQFGSEWTSTRTDTTSFDASSGSIYKDSTVNTVDAWGTVQLPSGNYQCLRIRSDSWTVTQLYLPGFELPPDTSKSISYIWINNESYMVVSTGSQDGEINPNFTDASYFSRLASGTVDVDGDQNLVPAEYILSQNYPNPFNPTTEINFSIPEDSNVNLKIFDITGKEVRALLDQNFNAGTYSATWDGKNNRGEVLPSGVYFYRIEAGNFTEAKKALLLK